MTADGAPQRAVLTVQEAAAVLGISKWQAYELIRRNEIPHIKLGSCIRVPRVQLDRLLAGSES